ncbi:Receptor-like protein 13 [Citrus sinensis]|nr:Receptor-like protein 13 [Citrus sinensis]
MCGSKRVWVSELIFILLVVKGWWSEGCLEQERSALLQLKHFFNDDHRLQNWVDTGDDENYSDCCQWEGVECNNTTGRVIRLDLAFRKWESAEWYMNASLFTPFQQLKSLDLMGNNIAGCVQNEGLDRLSSLKNLKFLDLTLNHFNNSIFSSLGGLSSLKHLSMGINELNGSIDIEGLESLSNLEELDISDNAIDNLVVPKGLDRLSRLNNLKFLSLAINHFNNSIFSFLCGLSSLRHLSLSDNRLNGSIDIKGLNSLSNLEELDMTGNAIENLVVPKDFRGLRKLNTLYLGGSGIPRIDGSKVLQSIGSLPSLKTLYLSHTKFKGTVVNQKLHNFTNLEELILDESDLHVSQLLQSIASFTSLKHLSMQDCVLKGALHGQGLCQLVHLQGLYIRDNDLRDGLPWCLANMTSLQVLYASSNQLTGNISPGLCELVLLRKLYIDNNDLRGSLPLCLANLTSLRVLDVSYNQLTENISSSSLMHLTSIEELILSNNHFFQIPISLEPLFNLSKLQTFNGEINAQTESHYDSLTPKFQLTSISLSGYVDGGTFPEFLYHQHDLNSVNLSHLNLSGEFPNWLLENNTNLETLLLANNSLFGSFRMPIHSHQKLATLDVFNNFFQGHIPVEIGTYLPGLMELNLSRNAFNGSIPSSFADMKMLERLDISNNQLTGEIPERMATGCFSLEILALSNNRLQGHIFSEKFNLTNLMTLQLDGNNFIGEIPESLSKCYMLRGLYLSDNHLFGKIPRWLGNLPTLQYIIMPNNNLEGPIPIEFCQRDSLKILDLSNNSIFGTLPSCFSPASIEQVHLSKNKIEGRLESIIHDNPHLVTLDLSYNSLHGSIPNRIDRLPQLNYLLLAHNYIKGEIPVQLCQLKEVRLIDLSHNNLSGRIPPCLVNTSLNEGYHGEVAPTSIWCRRASVYRSACLPGQSSPPMGKEETVQFTTKNMSYYYQGRILTSMSGIDLSCNKLTGEIPTQIGYLTRIHALNLSHNNLTGTIPTTFSNLKQIESLDLSYNLLHGKIPPQLIVLNTLEVFKVAYNNLSGKIPDRAQFSTFEEDSYEGNPFLCGQPLSKSCNDNGLTTVTPEASTENEGDSLIDTDSFLITFTVSYGIVIIGIIGVLYINPYWRRRWFYLVEVAIIALGVIVIDSFPPLFLMVTQLYTRTVEEAHNVQKGAAYLALLASIRGNRLEGFINGTKPAPEEQFTQVGAYGYIQKIDNPEYQNWRSQDQTLLGWMLSSISEGTLNLVINCGSSFDVWRTLEKKFGVQSEARVLQLRYELNTLRKESMSIEDYCIKMKIVADKLASAGSPIIEKDLMLTILNGLGAGYRDIATFITGSKMDYDDAYALLLTHETRLEQERGGYVGAQFGNTGRNHTAGRGNIFQSPRMFNGNHRGGYGRGHLFGSNNVNSFHAPRNPIQFARTGVTSMNGLQGIPNNAEELVCQICFKPGHTVDIYWHRFMEDYVPSSRSYDNYDNHPASETSCYSEIDNYAPAEAYVANFESFADDGWYLDSGATHHLTNNMENLHFKEDYKGTDQLIIENGQGLSISHIGHAFLSFRASKHPYTHATTIALKDMLLVPTITKNLLSIFKLTFDNSLSVEFFGNGCYVKDMKGQVLLQGLAKKGLYKLLIKSSSLSSSAYHTSPAFHLS